MGKLSDWIEERLFGQLWFRRAFGVALGLLVAWWPADVLWRLPFNRTSDWDSLAFVGSAIGFSILVLGFASIALPALGVPSVAGVVLFVPIVGGIFVLVWLWKLAPRWRSKDQRAADRERVLDGLATFEREVYRLRFNVDADLFYSRRKTAKVLGATKQQVAAAEARLLPRIDALTSALISEHSRNGR